MFTKKAGGPINLDKVDTIIGKDTQVKGSIMSVGVVRIDGKVEGDILHRGDMIIGESGSVIATVKARNVVVAGEVQGNIEAEGKLELLATGKVAGDIISSSLVIADGAVFKGKSQPRSEDKPVNSRPKPVDQA